MTQQDSGLKRGERLIEKVLAKLRKSKAVALMSRVRRSGVGPQFRPRHQRRFA